jgi:hypothetical protein
VEADLPKVVFKDPVGVGESRIPDCAGSVPFRPLATTGVGLSPMSVPPLVLRSPLISFLTIKVRVKKNSHFRECISPS